MGIFHRQQPVAIGPISDRIQELMDEICAFGKLDLYQIDNEHWRAYAKTMHRNAEIKISSGWDCTSALEALQDLAQKIRNMKHG